MVDYTNMDVAKFVKYTVLQVYNTQIKASSQESTDLLQEH
jgi:hypothetical protein